MEKKTKTGEKIVQKCLPSHGVIYKLSVYSIGRLSSILDHT